MPVRGELMHLWVRNRPPCTALQDAHPLHLALPTMFRKADFLSNACSTSLALLRLDIDGIERSCTCSILLAVQLAVCTIKILT
jgi:hypothetical protein